MDIVLARYAPPELSWRGETAQTEPILWWAIIVGFAFTVALAYAAYCSYLGGDPNISFGWTGFKVSCYR